MKTLGEIEIVEIFPFSNKISLSGRLISGGPISNEKDILLKDIHVSFLYNEKIITKKIIHLAGLSCGRMQN